MWKNKTKGKRKKILAPTTQKLRELREKEIYEREKALKKKNSNG